MSAWPTMYLIQSVNYSISSQDLWFLLGLILPFFGGVGTIPASGRGVPSLFRGSFHLFLSHWSNVTTIILLLEIALAFMDAAQLWSSCQVKSLLCSFQSPLLWALWLISYRAEVTVIVHLLVLLKLPFQTKLNQTKPNQTKLLFLLTLEWVQIWLSRNTLFPSTMGLSTRARLSIPTSISSIFRFCTIHRFHQWAISSPFQAVNGEVNLSEKCLISNPPPSCRPGCPPLFLVYISSVTLQSLGSDTISLRVGDWILQTCWGQGKDKGMGSL